MNQPQRYATRIGRVELETTITKIGDSQYRAAGEFNGKVIVEQGHSETAAFGRWYRAVELEVQNRT